MTDGSTNGDEALGVPEPQRGVAHQQAPADTQVDSQVKAPADTQVETLWTPTPEAVATTLIARFRAWLAATKGVELADYAQLWRWSVSELEAFWGALAESFEVRFHQRPEEVPAERVMPGARWFPGTTLNYAEQALLGGDGKADDDPAASFQREDGRTEQLTYGEVRTRVAAARAALAGLGVGRGDRVAALVGELVVTEPVPSMPVFFWNDPDGSRLREARFGTYPGIWRHGDWIKFTERGSAVIYGRSDSTLNRGGVRMGTAEFYRVVEAFAEVADSLVIDTSGAGRTGGELPCFLGLAPGSELATVEPKLRSALREQLSPRHVPNAFIVIDTVPRTPNGKKCEVPVKKILSGMPVDRAISADALRDPDSLRPFVELAGGQH
ncbi:MAG TPA: acetyl-coenzyme A synthetase N-terminal domain-containing protein [Pseudonocardiaceae bacterium]|jgi:hypothetical protein|nr:acetyl-coenzyme A synthetase N-terminal domain-containing protein [Pseudonocardiaceae bacterium]